MTEFLIFLFTISFFIQWLFLFVFDLSLISHKPRSGKTEGKYPSVSIIIPTHNNKVGIETLIDNLLIQQYPKVQIVIVADRCKDGTLSFLKQKENALIDVVSIENSHSEYDPKKYAIKKGIERATGEVILLTDDDCTPKSDSWVSEMVNSYNSKTKIVIGQSYYRKRKGFLNLFIRYETILTALNYVSLTLLGLPYMGVGRNLSYRKDIFIKNDGIEDIKALTGGDDDLFINKVATKRNTNVCLSTKAMVLSEPKKTIRSFFRQKVRHLAAGKKYNLKSKAILGLNFLTTLLFYVSGIIFAINLNEPIVFLMALSIRWIALMISMDRLVKKSDEKFEIFYIAILDVVYLIYYLVTATYAGITRKVSWT